jgi:hypothetical protein
VRKSRAAKGKRVQDETIMNDVMRRLREIQAGSHAKDE